MLDRDKVIKALECHMSRKCETDAVKHEICPYWEYDDCGNRLMYDALELLKEQEPIPVQTSNGIVHCGNCGKGLIWIGRKPKPEWKYCAYCGKRVKWDDRAREDT